MFPRLKNIHRSQLAGRSFPVTHASSQVLLIQRRISLWRQKASKSWTFRVFYSSTPWLNPRLAFLCCYETLLDFLAWGGHNLTAVSWAWLSLALRLLEQLKKSRPHCKPSKYLVQWLPNVSAITPMSPSRSTWSSFNTSQWRIKPAAVKQTGNNQDLIYPH